MPSITTINLSSAAGELSRASASPQAVNRQPPTTPNYVDQIQIQKAAQIASVQLKRTDDSPPESLPNYVEKGNGANKKRAKGEKEPGDDAEFAADSGDSGDESDAPVKVNVVA